MWPKMAFQLAEVQKQLLKLKPNGVVTVMEQVRRERSALCTIEMFELMRILHKECHHGIK